ncbi:MAG: hypothetical protein Q6373_019820 [Candidatus Sigynarchaeota archaeon]
MDLFESERDHIGLSNEIKRRVALILQGTSDGPGVNIKQLRFTTSPEEIDREIDAFIKLVNKHYEGVIQFVRSGEIIVPIIVNKEAIEQKRRSISSKTIMLASIILLHEFVNHQGPTLANLEKKFQVTNIDTKEIQALLRELKMIRWVEEIEEAGVKYFNPTPVLKGCISPEMLLAEYSAVFHEASDPGEKELLLSFLPREYIKVQRTLRTSQISILDSIQRAQDKEKGEDQDGKRGTG